MYKARPPPPKWIETELNLTINVNFIKLVKLRSEIG